VHVDGAAAVKENPALHAVQEEAVLLPVLQFASELATQIIGFVAFPGEAALLKPFAQPL